MKLRTKTTFIIAAAWVAICLIVYADARWVVSANYQRLEEALIKSEIQDARRAYSMTLHTLAMYATAWAVWDEAYAFMQKKNDKFIQSNFVPGTFTTSNINFFLLYDKNGQFYYGGAYDFTKNEMVPVPSSLLSYLEQHGEFVRHEVIDSKHDGILRTTDGLVMMTSLPVVTGDKKGPVAGSLLMGYYLDKRYFDNLSETIGSKADFYNRTEILLNPDVLSAYENLHLKNDDFTVADDGRVAYGYMLLNDVNNEPAGMIRIEIPRTVYFQGIETTLHYIFIVVGLGFVVIFMTWYLLKLFVLDRIISVGDQVQVISKSEKFDSTIQVVGNDEISELVHDINSMIKMIDGSQKKLTYIASHDPLTNLPNRTMFYNALNEEIERSAANQSRLAVLFIDMDGFKAVNDQYGHNVGDKLLVSISKRLRNNLRSGDLIARQSGDEFIAFLRDIKDPQDVTRRVVAILDITSKPFKIDEIEIQARFSIGVSIYPDDAINEEALLRCADQAMYTVKNMSGNSYCFYKDISHLLQD